MKSKKKELTIVIIIFAIVIILGVVYFAMKSAGPGNESSAAVERVFVYPNIERANVKDITVTNSKGSFQVYREADNNFYFKGAELVGYNNETFSSLMVNATYMLSMYEIDDVTDYSQYGLDVEKNKPAFVEINTTDGKYHKIFIGNEIPTGGGYYVKYYNKDTVYVLDSSISTTFLCSIYDLLQPFVTIQLSSSSDYINIDNFYFLKRINETDEKSSPFVSIRKKTDAEKPADGTTMFPYIMVYPESVYTASTEAYSAVQQTLSSLAGTKVVDYGIIPADAEKDPTGYAAYIARLAKWGLDKPMYEVIYTYKNQNFYASFSKADADGNIYAYSMLTSAVIQLPLSSVKFLSWDLFDFIEPQVFSENIKTVSKIVTSFDGKEYVYDIKADAKGTVTDVYANGKAYDVSAFKKYYTTFLEFVALGEIEPTPAGTQPILTVNVTCTAGNLEYKFFVKETRKYYYTINGKGEFYISPDKVKQFMKETIAIYNGELVE